MEPFFSNLDKNVFVLKNLPEVVSGALFSRYSRSAKSLRMVLLEEFISEKESGFNEIVNYQLENGSNQEIAGKESKFQLNEVKLENRSSLAKQEIATKKAEEFYDRILVGYGDDSVAELGGCHIALEKISIIAAKALQDSRIGLSPLEKSTRYVLFDEKIGGKYQYFLEPDIMESGFEKDYIQACDFLFDSYSELLPKLRENIEEWFPKDLETSDRAYNATIKAKTCDLLRGLLPASTLTNMGFYGNGRAFEYLVLKMHCSQLKEVLELGKSMHEELMSSIPSFVKRAVGKYGNPAQDFFKTAEKNLKDFSEKNLKQQPLQCSEVELADFDIEAENKIVAALLYSHSNLPLRQLREIVSKMPLEEKRKAIKASLGHRQNRRHKPLRAFENAFYCFDILSNYGMYRDLHRHRMLTQERQLLTCNFGYTVPEEIKKAGFLKKFEKPLNAAKAVFEKISKKMPLQSQYVVPLAFKIRWYFRLNARELFHLIELRSTQQGHADYRRVSIEMFKLAKKATPLVFELMNFVDEKEYGLERLQAEKKTDEKMNSLKNS